VKGDKTLVEFRNVLQWAIDTPETGVARRRRATLVKLKQLAGNFLLEGKVVFHFQRCRPAYTSPVLRTLARSLGLGKARACRGAR